MGTSAATKSREGTQKQSAAHRSISPRPLSRSPFTDALELQKSVGNQGVGEIVNPTEHSKRLPDQVAAAIQTPSQPLDARTRSFMESRFGQNFSDVQVHANAPAGASALSIDAGAYTIGKHIVFGPEFYSPETAKGRTVLAHELAHVVQQTHNFSGDSAVNATHENEANRVAAEIGLLGIPTSVHESAGVGIARMSIAEARRALWGHVPDSVKGYVQPIAQKAAAEMDKVISPDAQLPKAVEAVVEHPVEALKAAVAAPVQAAKASLQPKPGAGGANQQASIAQLAKRKVKEKARDYALENLGELKGIALEAGNIVDTLAWLPQAGHELAQSALGSGPVADKVLAASDVVSGYAVVQAVTEKTGWSDVDPVTGKPTGALSVSGAIGRGFDYGADAFEGATGLPKEDALLFTSYETGELTGAVGTQVALAFVGVEEVQLALKAVGAIGAARSIVESVQKNPKGFAEDPKFWSGILNAVLTVIGLSKARSAQKIIKIVLAGGGVVNAVPAVWQLYKDYTDESLAQSPDREKKIKGDIGQIVKILSSVVLEVVRNRAPAKQPGAEPSEGPSTRTKPSTTEGETPGTAKPAVPEAAAAAPENVPAAAAPSPASVVTEAPVTAAKPPGAVEAGAAPKKAPSTQAGGAKKPAPKGAQPSKKSTQRPLTARPQTPSGLELDPFARTSRPSTYGERDLGPPSTESLELNRSAEPSVPSTHGERDLGPPTTENLELNRAAKPSEPSTYGERDLGPPSTENLELNRAAKPSEPSTYGERDLGAPGPSGLELHTGPQAEGTGPHNERTLDAPTGQAPKVYKGGKPLDKIPGIRKAEQKFGESSTEKSGTFHRKGVNYRELNAAEIVQELRLDYDAKAGRPNSVSYKVDASAASTQAVSERAFGKDVSVEAPQSKDSAYTDSGYDRGHLAQREAFKGSAESEQAVDQFTNVVPMKPELNRGAGSPWRAAEADTIRLAREYGSVSVRVEPIYDSNAKHLSDGTPIPKAIRRTVTAPDGTVLQDATFLNR
jgi:DNA/RNA endonuclease G (NUC1)